MLLSATDETSQLAARIDRRIAAISPPARRRLPSLLAKIYDLSDDAITALQGSRPPRVTVDREPGETLAALTVRARALIDEVMLFAVYPEDMRREPEPARKPAVEPEMAWDEAAKPWGETDMASLAGVGRTATKEELARHPPMIRW